MHTFIILKINYNLFILLYLSKYFLFKKVRKEITIFKLHEANWLGKIRLQVEKKLMYNEKKRNNQKKDR